MDDWQKNFQAGDIVIFRDTDDNPPFHYSLPGRILRIIQAWSEKGDPSVIHVGLIHGLNPEAAKPGETEMLILDSMPGEGVAIRPLVRNYSIEVYRLKPEIAAFGSDDIAKIPKKAMEVAKKFIDMKYSVTHCRETLTHASTRENTELNEYYCTYLYDRHYAHDQLNPDFIEDGVNCSEFAITCYQLAVLELTQEKVTELPEFIKIHAHTSPANFHEFLKTSNFYDRIDLESTEALRYSGHPHPKDNTKPSTASVSTSQAMILYNPQLDVSKTSNSFLRWGEWLWSYFPAVPGISSAASVLRLLPAILQNSSTQVPIALEMQSQVNHKVLFLKDSNHVVTQQSEISREQSGRIMQHKQARH